MIVKLSNTITKTFHILIPAYLKEILKADPKIGQAILTYLKSSLSFLIFTISFILKVKKMSLKYYILKCYIFTLIFDTYFFIFHLKRNDAMAII